MNKNLFFVQWNFLLIILEMKIKYLHCILPPSYVVDFRDKENFEISSDDDYDENENEMLHVRDLREIESLAEDEGKYKPLHYHVENDNRREDAKKIGKISKRNSHNDLILERNIIDESKPFVAGFQEALDKIKYETPEILPEMQKRLKDTTVESAWRKLFFATPKNENEGYVNSENNNRNRNKNKNKNKKKRIKRSEVENSDFFQGTDENSTEDVTDFEKNQFTELSTTEEINDKAANESSDDYDYEKLRIEYYQQIDKLKRKNELFIYTEGEIFQETTTLTIIANNKSSEMKNKNLDDILEVKNSTLEKNNNSKGQNFAKHSKKGKFKKPLNCTKVESFFIGPKTLECLSNAFKNVNNFSDLINALKRTWNVTKFWIIFYISVSIACWCQKGWCCCCCCCEFCYPEEVMLREKKYFAENPPGILVNKEKEGKLLKITNEEYKPTLFETDAYEIMESQIRNL